jgi:hypothetical protein
MTSQSKQKAGESIQDNFSQGNKTDDTYKPSWSSKNSLSGKAIPLRV